MKAEILVDDPLERYLKGDTGEILENDFDKYDYKLLLDNPRTEIMGHYIKIMYFYKDEIKEL